MSHEKFFFVLLLLELSSILVLVSLEAWRKACGSMAIKKFEWL